jgi:anti-sigma factor RsiW
MNSEEAGRLLHAYVDGELDSATSLELEAYLAGNPAARAACERLRDMSAAIRDKADYHAAPALLAARLRAAVPAVPDEITRRPAWLGRLGLAASFAAVILVTWFAAIAYQRPERDERVAQDVIASHLRATLSNHLADVASSDQHTVKPWLSARLVFSPPVTDLSAHGFELLGGRLDYIAGRTVAALAYKRRQHTIDVFIWPAPDDTAITGERTYTHDGFNVARFTRDGMTYWMVSDLNRNELSDLSQLIASQGRAP